MLLPQDFPPRSFSVHEVPMKANIRVKYICRNIGFHLTRGPHVCLTIKNQSVRCVNEAANLSSLNKISTQE